MHTFSKFAEDGNFRGVASSVMGDITNSRRLIHFRCPALMIRIRVRFTAKSKRLACRTAKFGRGSSPERGHTVPIFIISVPILGEMSSLE
jgi:hypothetical protein